MSKRYAPMAVAANHGWVFTIRRNLADLVRMAVRLLRGGIATICVKRLRVRRIEASARSLENRHIEAFRRALLRRFRCATSPLIPRKDRGFMQS
jgi:hypothetical protein